MSTTTIIIISLLIANLALTFMIFWNIFDLLGAVKSLRDSEELLNSAFNMCEKQMMSNNTILKSVGEKYDKMMHAYGIMRERYDAIIEGNTELLKCWKSIEERYSQSYEEFKHCSDKLKEISFQITDLADASTEDEYYLTLQEACNTVCIDCPYGGLKCHDCPVWQLMHRDDIPDGIEGETPPDREGMKEFFKKGGERKAHNEWTDEDYLEEGNDIAKD